MASTRGVRIRITRSKKLVGFRVCAPSTPTNRTPIQEFASSASATMFVPRCFPFDVDGHRR